MNYIIAFAAISPFIACAILGAYVRNLYLKQIKNNRAHWKVNHLKSPLSDLEPITKGRAWSPRKDMDHVMSGKVVDMFD